MTTITATADFIIIGGGIAGVSVGARLAKDHSVILLEAEPALGYHSSGRSAAMLIENYGNPVSRELIGMSAPFFRESDEFGPVPLVKPWATAASGFAARRRSSSFPMPMAISCSWK